MSKIHTGHVGYVRADFWKIRFEDRNSTKSTRIDLKLCRDILGSVEKISSKHQHPKPNKFQAISKSIKKGGVFSKFLKRVNFRARVVCAQTTWWEWFSDVLARFEPTQKPPKARIQRNHQTRLRVTYSIRVPRTSTQEKGDIGRGRTPKPNQNEIDLDLDATRTRGG